MKLHMDGARVFNAAAALGVPVTELTEPVDSVMFCLSKGLSAPIGSILAGSKEFIDRARKFRSSWRRHTAGWGMPAGIVALEEMVDRLAEDHQRAQRLADGLSQVPGVKVAETNYRTNILLVDVEGTGLSAPEFSKRLKENGSGLTPRAQPPCGRFSIGI